MTLRTKQTLDKFMMFCLHILQSYAQASEKTEEMYIQKEAALFAIGSGMRLCFIDVPVC